MQCFDCLPASCRLLRHVSTISRYCFSQMYKGIFSNTKADHLSLQIKNTKRPCSFLKLSQGKIGTNTVLSFGESAKGIKKILKLFILVSENTALLWLRGFLRNVSRCGAKCCFYKPLLG